MTCVKRVTRSSVGMSSMNGEMLMGAVFDIISMQPSGAALTAAAAARQACRRGR
jgi:hypothetical protein